MHITIETKLDFKSYVRLMYSLTYQKLSMILLTMVGLFLLILSILYSTASKALPGMDLGVGFLFGLYIIIAYPISVYSNAKKVFSPLSRLSEDIIYDFTDDKIKMTGETFYSEMNWEKVYKLVELNSWILIFETEEFVSSVPKKAFDDKLTDFKELVKTKTFLKQEWKGG